MRNGDATKIIQAANAWGNASTDRPAKWAAFCDLVFRLEDEDRASKAAGGSAKTEAKRRASAENGRKGGRPRKSPAPLQ